MLNILANLYLEKHVAVHRPAGSFEFFTERGRAISRSPAGIRGEAVQLFDSQEGLVAPDEERTNMGLKLADAVAALHNAQQSIVADEHRIRDVQSQMKSTPSRSTTQQVSNSSTSAASAIAGQLADGASQSRSVVDEV